MRLKVGRTYKTRGGWKAKTVYRQDRGDDDVGVSSRFLAKHIPLSACFTRFGDPHPVDPRGVWHEADGRAQVGGRMLGRHCGDIVGLWEEPK